VFVLLAVFLAGCGTAPRSKDGEARRESRAATQPARVLFVGNSLTYYGNVPAVFSALAEANGTSIVGDMIVAPGATLSQRVADGSVAKALGERQYTALVLQERGGALAGFFGSDALDQSRQAVKNLAAIAGEKGLPVWLMGTYQARPDVSESLIEAESSAASEAGIQYIEVSEKLQRLMKAAPDLTWFADDGQHPGKHLALLNAILVHEAVLGSLPDPGPLVVSAPIYGSNTGLDETLRQAQAPPPRTHTPREARYSCEAVARILGTLNVDRQEIGAGRRSVPGSSR